MDMKAVIHEHSHFIIQLYKEAISQEHHSDGNTVISPISISTCLAMAAAGAKHATLQQFQSSLNLPSPPSMHDFSAQIRSIILADGSPNNGPALSFVNGTFIDLGLGLKSTFRGVLEKQYGAVARQTDFQHKAENARLDVNNWIKYETKGKVEQLLPPGSVDNNTRLLLVNVLYFKGLWKKPFEMSETTEEDFHLINGETIKVPMMTTKKKQQIYAHNSFKILRLPYEQGTEKRSFSMYILLPNERNGLPELVTNMEVGSIEQHLVVGDEMEVGKFKLPKFKVSFGFEVTETLKNLGLTLPFSNEADFSDMVELPDTNSLAISKVFHNSFVEVSEEGTEAAAATASVIMLKCINFDPPVDFVADHPFMFVIKEDTTGILLFIGHVTNPIG